VNICKEAPVAPLQMPNSPGGPPSTTETGEVIHHDLQHRFPRKQFQFLLKKILLGKMTAKGIIT
jgi:hypothetical protein